MPELGRLERVDLRTAWETEAQDFTPWLAQKENIAVLSETLGVDLEVEAREQAVGDFSADILCRDRSEPGEESWVLIENQLELTDHRHLGQLLTYAAGLRTVTIIWIAQPFRDEHRATLDWLNDITDKRYRFFGLEVELWRIGESPAAPKFNIVSKPNNWSRDVDESVTVEHSETKQRYRQYWDGFLAHLDERKSPFARNRTPGTRSFFDFAIGRSHCTLRATLRWERQLSVHLDLHGPDFVAYMDLLARDKDGIEAAIGNPLEWRRFQKSCQVLLINPKETNFDDERDWAWQYEWLAETLERFDKVFRPLVQALDAADWVPEEDLDALA